MTNNNSAIYISPGTGRVVTQTFINEIHSPTTVLIKIAAEVEIQ